MKERKLLTYQHLHLIIAFLFANLIYIFYTSGLENMMSVSTDAADIWKSITSFRSKSIYGSYVLYKGINSIYPYIWLYELSSILRIDEWFFIKAFYSISFSYISAIGFPNMIEMLTGNKTKLYRRCLCSVIMWYLWYYSFAFTELMIDLPCLLYYVLLINAALALYRRGGNISNYVWIGFLSGLCMTASGQYSLPSVCILIFVFWITTKVCIQKKLFIKLWTYLLPLVICLSTVLYVNKNFEDTVVTPLREEGAWIPTGDNWLEAGLVRFRGDYRAVVGSISIPSHRNEAIFKDYFEYNESQIESITIPEYLLLFFSYPADFVLNYLNSFFLILSPDGGALNFWPLFIFYTLLYISLYIGVTRCRTWKNFFSPLFWIGFSFLWATVPLLVMNIEPRTCMQIQGLIIALAVCDNTIWNYIKLTKENLKAFSFKKNTNCRISYPIVFYLIFIIICFMHISTLYETIGADPQAILIQFK